MSGKLHGSRIVCTVLILIVVSVLFAGIAVASAVESDTDAIDSAPVYDSDSFFVKYIPAAESGAALPCISSSSSPTILKDYSSLVPGLMLVEVPEGFTVEEAIAGYIAIPGVSYAEPNYLVTSSAVPNDANYTSYQWGMHNTPDMGGISAESAWDISTGNDSVIVAVLDSGIDFNHPDLEAHIWNNTNEIPGNNIDDDKNGYIDDVYGWNFIDGTNDLSDYCKHGTHCAGVIGAVSNNGIGVAGTAWNVTIMPVMVLNHMNAGEDAKIISGIEYAVNNGAKIISMSFGGDKQNHVWRDAIVAGGKKGVLFVVSAGNAGKDNDIDPQYPAGYNCTNILSVAASNSSNMLADFSNWGNISIDIAAPGVDILSTVPNIRTNSTLISNFSQDDVEVLGDPWRCGTNMAYIYGENTSLLYYNISILPTEVNNLLGIEFWFFCNLSSNPDTAVKIYLSNTSFSTYTSITDFQENKTGIYEVCMLNNLSRIVSAQYMPVGFTKEATKLGNGPYYIGVYYTSTNPKEIFDLCSLEFIYDYIHDGHTYENMSGTSMATPMVAGVTAVMKAINPSLTPEEIIQIVVDTADRYPAFTDKIRSGGRLNFSAALMKARPEFNVTFNSTGGSAVTSQNVFYGDMVTRPSPDPERDGYVFEDWYTDTTFSTRWDFNTGKISSAVTLYANWTMNETISMSDSSGTAEFNGNNFTAIKSTTGTISRVILESVNMVNGSDYVTFTADNTTLSVPDFTGYTKSDGIAVFEIRANLSGNSSTVPLIIFNVTFKDTATATANKGKIKFSHYNITKNAWDKTPLEIVDIQQANASVSYEVETSSFSPFGIGIYTVASTPVTPSSSSSSSHHSGGSMLLQSGQNVPVVDTPTVVPTVEPTQSQSTVLPSASSTTLPTQQSPAPVAGIIAGLGVAVFILTRMRR